MCLSLRRSGDSIPDAAREDAGEAGESAPRAAFLCAGCCKARTAAPIASTR